MKHHLKVQPPYFDHLLDGKNFEVRRDDRGYQKGDVLRLREYDPRGTHDECDDPYCDTKRYTGRELVVTVGYVYRGGFGCDLHGWVVLGLDGRCENISCPVATPHIHESSVAAKEAE